MLQDKRAEVALGLLACELGWDTMSTEDMRVLAAAAFCYFAERMKKDGPGASGPSLLEVPKLML